MIKNFNWGHGIALFYICFVGIVITALIASFSVDRDLVVDDYYATDLAYQDRYDKITNNVALNNVDIKVENNLVIIKFLDSIDAKGSVQFYRASDKSQDFTKEIEGPLLSVPVSEMAKGKWSVKIDWTEEEKAFYKEEVIYL